MNPGQPDPGSVWVHRETSHRVIVRRSKSAGMVSYRYEARGAADGPLVEMEASRFHACFRRDDEDDAVDEIIDDLSRVNRLSSFDPTDAALRDIEDETR